MDTFSAVTKVSGDGQIALKAPDVFKDATVYVTVQKKAEAGPVDEFGWPVGFWDNPTWVISDPNFKRPRQSEAEPPPSIE